MFLVSFTSFHPLSFLFVFSMKVISMGYSKKIRNKAIRILESGQAFYFFIRTWERSYAIADNDYSLGGAVICTIISTIISNSKGIHIKVGGASGHGKSYGVETSLALFPPSKSHDSSITAKGLFYCGVKEGTVLYYDDINARDDDVYPVLKRCTTKYQSITRHTTANGTFEIPPRIAWIVSAVDSFDDEQLLTRFVMCEISDSAERQAAIYSRQVEEEEITQEKETDTDILVCQCMYEILAEQGLYTVKIPFTRAIEWHDIAHPRTFPLFKDMIRCMTVLNSRQREKHGECYLAAIEDFEAAQALYSLIERSNTLKLTGKEQAILVFLCTQKEPVDRATIHKHMTNMSYKTVMRLMDGLAAKCPTLIAEELPAITGGTKWYYSYAGQIGKSQSVALDTHKAELEILEYKKRNQIPLDNAGQESKGAVQT